MVEHATRCAPLVMGRPALLLLLLCAVCIVSTSARPSLRPTSPDEFRKLLLWAQNAAELGELQPPFPSPEQLNEVDKVWSKSHKKGYLHDADLIGQPHRSYVESTEFRRRRPTSSNEGSSSLNLQSAHLRAPFPHSELSSQPTQESPVVENLPVVENHPQNVPVIIEAEKRTFPKKIDHTRSKPISETLAYYTDDNPGAKKPLETLSHPAIIYVNDSDSKKSLPDPFGYAKTEDSNVPQDRSNITTDLTADSVAQEASNSATATKEKPVAEKKVSSVESLPPSHIPPVWGHSLLSEELTGASISKLPSYEEYDRNERYSHSILHGFTGY